MQKNYKLWSAFDKISHNLLVIVVTGWTRWPINVTLVCSLHFIGMKNVSIFTTLMSIVKSKTKSSSSTVATGIIIPITCLAKMSYTHPSKTKIRIQRLNEIHPKDRLSSFTRFSRKGIYCRDRVRKWLISSPQTASRNQVLPLPPSQLHLLEKLPYPRSNHHCHQR